MYHCLDVHVRNMLVRGTIKIWQDKIEDNFWIHMHYSIFQKLSFFFFSRGGHADNSRAPLWISACQVQLLPS